MPGTVPVAVSTTKLTVRFLSSSISDNLDKTFENSAKEQNISAGFSEEET